MSRALTAPTIFWLNVLEGRCFQLATLLQC